MKYYAKSFFITTIITITTFVFTLVIHYSYNSRESDFWTNICLAIFGSSLLTMVSSYIGYRREKIKTLEGFSYSTKSLLSYLNKYDIEWDDERKIDFFLDYNSLDKTLWDSKLGDIFFLIDREQENFLYIYNQIYKPILDLNHKISEHEFHFRWHKDGSGHNKVVMHKFIAEIEPLFIEKQTIVLDNTDGSNTSMTSTRNKLVSTLLDELNGRYYDLMYNKKHN